MRRWLLNFHSPYTHTMLNIELMSENLNLFAWLVVLKFTGHIDNISKGWKLTLGQIILEKLDIEKNWGVHFSIVSIMRLSHSGWKRVNSSSLDLSSVWNEVDGVWLGGSDIFSEGSWEWVGSKIPITEYTDWGPNEPNSIAGNGRELTSHFYQTQITLTECLKWPCSQNKVSCTVKLRNLSLLWYVMIIFAFFFLFLPCLSFYLPFHRFISRRGLSQYVERHGLVLEWRSLRHDKRVVLLVSNKVNKDS